MKYKPIVEPKLIGCLNCSPVPPVKLKKTHRWYLGMSSVWLKVDGKHVADWNEDKTPTVEEITELYADEIQAGECALIEVTTPLHGEIYEHNKADGEWYLVQQNLGFA